MNWPLLSDSRRGPSWFLPRTSGSVWSAPRRNSSSPQHGHMTFFSIAMIPFCGLTCARAAAKKHGCANKVSEVVPATGIRERIDSVVGEYSGKKTEQDKEAMNQPREEPWRVVCIDWRLRRTTRKQCGYGADGKN